MSSFCWCIIKIKKHWIEHFFLEWEKREKKDICFMFDKKNRFLESPLSTNEFFCNIACGYDSLPHLLPKGMLNNDERYFGYALPSKKIDNNAFELAQKELKKRLDSFQNVISDMYNMVGVYELKLFYTDSANENSLLEYKRLYCKIDELSTRMYELIENNLGILPSITLEWKKS